MATKQKEALVETDEVAKSLGNRSPKILEVDEDTEAYANGHVPGALVFDWKDDLQDPLRRDFIGP